MELINQSEIATMGTRLEAYLKSEQCPKSIHYNSISGNLFILFIMNARLMVFINGHLSPVSHGSNLDFHVT